MNFYDKIQEMDYQLKEKNNDYIIIEKQRKISDILIIFDIKNKIIAGYLKPNNIITDLEGITYQYSVFREMKRDLKSLSQMSSYDIL